ncbi:MAG: GldG family protein, partial [Alphaproteobacteria bacterium]|nr:GldG family protein [Alphaproteobacteria bacterium]
MMAGRPFMALGLFGALLLAAGGIVYSIEGELGPIALGLIWAGLLALLLFFYVHFTTFRDLIAKRSTKYGVNMAFMIAVFLVIMSLIGVMSVRYKVRLDLTETRRYSLSAQTVKILRSLDQEVEAIAFYRSDERTRQAMYDLLAEYAYHSPSFKFWFVDPDKKPLEAAKYGVTSYRTTLIRSAGNQETVGFESEGKVTTALIRATRGKVKTAYFLTGHGERNFKDGERSGYAAAKQAIEKEHYRVAELLLVGDQGVPDDAAVLVVAGPKKDLLPAELEKIAAYIKGNGKLLFLADPGPTPSVSAFLEGYGFTVGHDIVVDKRSRMIGANYLFPVVVNYNQDHMVTRDFSLVTFFPIARSVSVEENSAKGTYNLAQTGTSSWAMTKGKIDEDNVEFDPTKDRRGPINLVSVLVTKDGEGLNGTEKAKGSKAERVQRWGKIAVVGDSDFASNAHLNLMGNKDLFLNLLNWLTEETALISVRSKEPGLTPLTMTETQGRIAFWLSVIIGPT